MQQEELHLGRADHYQLEGDVIRGVGPSNISTVDAPPSLWLELVDTQGDPEEILEFTRQWGLLDSNGPTQLEEIQERVWLLTQVAEGVKIRRDYEQDGAERTFSPRFRDRAVTLLRTMLPPHDDIPDVFALPLEERELSPDFTDDSLMGFIVHGLLGMIDFKFGHVSPQFKVPFTLGFDLTPEWTPGSGSLAQVIGTQAIRALSGGGPVEYRPVAKCRGCQKLFEVKPRGRVQRGAQGQVFNGTRTKRPLYCSPTCGRAYLRKNPNAPRARAGTKTKRD